MEIRLQNLTEAASGVMSVDAAVFDAPYNEALIHQTVTAYLAGGRAGTAAQKTRAEVRGSTAKPWKQKGTGRARAGHVRSPIWRGGGVTFAAKTSDHSQKLNKKMYRGALRSILSELIRQERLVAVDSLNLQTHKTQDLLGQLAQFGKAKILIIADDVSDNLWLASRNVHTIRLADPVSLEPVSLVWAEKVIATQAALKALEERFA
ncbi:MAG: ribosomal protein [Pseudomonadota bacterium]|jgi:large subunit ribosomal protein L4